MLDFLAKYFRFPVAFVLSFVLSAVFFLAIPVINALMSDKGVKGQKELEAVTEVEVLVSEKKPEVNTNESTNATGNRKYFARKSSMY